MLKFHLIPAFMKTYTNFKKIFLVRVFWLKYIFRIKLKIPILELILLPKNSVPFEGLYSSSVIFLLVVLLVGQSYMSVPFPGHTYLLINTRGVSCLFEQV